MKRYLPWLMVGGLLVAVLAAACGGDGKEEPSPTPTATSTPTPTGPPFSFEGPVGIDLTIYGVFPKPGEQVLLGIAVAVAEPMTLYYRTTQRYDIVVTDSEDKEVWRWSKDKEFGQVLEQVSLEANESLTFSEVWDQRGNDGQPVPLGNYRVTATSTHCDANYENCGQLTALGTLQIRAS
jgi:hypothetical protein